MLAVPLEAALGDRLPLLQPEADRLPVLLGVGDRQLLLERLTLLLAELRMLAL